MEAEQERLGSKLHVERGAKSRIAQGLVAREQDAYPAPGKHGGRFVKPSPLASHPAPTHGRDEGDVPTEGGLTSAEAGAPVSLPLLRCGEARGPAQKSDFEMDLPLVRRPHP